MRGCAAACALLGLVSCAQVAHAPVGSRFGLERGLAVEVCYPPGVVAFLRRLRCADGSQAREVERVSVGARTATSKSDPRLLEQLDAGRPLRPGEPDLHIVERFTLSCPEGDKQVYLDMYHCLKAPPEQAPEGLGLE